MYTGCLELPFFIQSSEDLYCFEKFHLEPNFITLNKVQSSIKILDDGDETSIKGKIILISEADPGYDWIFNQGITGLITKYGGANSHMAIRSAELNLPSVVGIGEKYYEELTNCHEIYIDCENKIINIIK